MVDEEDIIKIGKEIIPNIYDDGAKPAIKEMGNFIARPLKLINTLFQPLDVWLLNKEYNLEKTKVLLAERLKHVAENELVSPAPYVALPAIAALSYSMDSEELRDLYANLLSKAMELYFKNFRTINGLFKNIDDYYRVANSIEIDNFKQFDIIKFTSDFEIKTNNLRMLALLEDDEDLDLSDNSLKSTLLTSYSKYPQQEFKEENGVFIINSNKSLTCFLKLVLGRLYTNPITQHQMEANYARKLN